MAKIDELPRVPAWLIPGTIHILAWCRYCGDYHFHGSGGEGRRPSGHRAAHCSTVRLKGKRLIDWRSPFWDDGYVLHDMGDATAAMIKDSQRKRPHGPDWLDAHG